MIGFDIVEEKQFAELASMAKTAWHDAYDELIGEAQVDYMLEKYQSESAIREQVTNQNYEYYFMVTPGEKLGYVGLAVQNNKRMFLSKLYVKKEHQGKGVGATTVNFAKIMAWVRACKKLFLTVNKNNGKAIALYEKCGLKRVDSVVTDIGGGYVMDDYIYEIDVKRPEMIDKKL